MFCYLLLHIACLLCYLLYGCVFLVVVYVVLLVVGLRVADVFCCVLVAHLYPARGCAPS